MSNSFVLNGVDCMFILFIYNLAYFIYLFSIVSAKSISIEDSTVWTTTDKTFEAWICPLVYALISYCDDLILRLVIFIEKNVNSKPFFFFSP